MPSESSTSTSSSVTNSKKVSSSSKAPAAVTADVVKTSAEKVGMLAKVRSLPVYIQVLGVLVVIAFMYVATNKKALKLFEKKKADEITDAASEASSEADEDEVDNEPESAAATTEDAVTTTPTKTVRFEDEANNNNHV